MINETEIKVPGNWLQADFHVHSPCSYDFHCKESDDVNYLSLLENALTSNIDIIVITDHNDIRGYQKLQEIENDLIGTIRTFGRTTSDIPESIKYQINLFEKVIVLPGVELDVYPNIHLVVLFDPQRLDEVSDFIDRAGFTPELRGLETTSKNTKWSLEQTLLESEKIGAIVIAAHVDSDKGLYEASKKWGQNRITAFCNERLYGMEFINPVSRDQIESIMACPDYSRNSKLAFIQSSDYHGKPGQKIGDRRTFIRLDIIDVKEKSSVFQAIKQALRNPDEFISAPGGPELKAILKKLKDKPAIETIDVESERLKFIKLVNAFANTEDGTVTIGKNSKGNWVGQVKNSDSEFISEITTIITSSLFPVPLFDCQVYPFYENKYIASVRIKKHSQICIVIGDDKIYLQKSGEVKQALSNEIIDMAEKRLIQRYANLSITKKLSEMSLKLLGSEDSIDILPVVRKIDKNSITWAKAIRQMKKGLIISIKDLDSLDFPGYGYVNGNIILGDSSRPRYEEYYLRLTAPIAKCELEFESKLGNDIETFTGEKIIIIPGGGIYYDVNEKIIIAGINYSPIIILGEKLNYDLGLKFLTAYLKSSVAIWYAERCLGTCDIRTIRVIQKLPIPLNIDDINKQNAEKIIDDLLILEKEFINAHLLIEQEYQAQGKRDSIEFGELSYKLQATHNSKANLLIKKIDDLFYNIFDLSPKEILIIERLLKTMRIATFSDTNLLEQETVI